MDRDRVSGPASGDRRRGHGKRTRPSGIRVVPRDGHWHLHGTIRVNDRPVRVRQSTGLPARPDTWDAAERKRLETEREIWDAIVEGRSPSVPVESAAYHYLNAPRARPLGATSVAHVKKATIAFRGRLLAKIAQHEWVAFVDQQTKGRKAETRERFLNSVVGFLHYCGKPARGWIKVIPAFERDNKARNPTTRSKRPVQLLAPELVMLMIDHAAPHLAAMMAIEWSTGARVKSVIYGCRLCDLVLAEGREQITFHDTKNGKPVTAALHPWVARVVARYLEVRGRLHDREAPLFLRPDGEPYSEAGRFRSGQNRTAFNAMKRRTAATIRRRAAAAARAALRRGDRAAARETILQGKEAARLVGRVTQHWFRHMLATQMLQKGDLKAAMDQGGWLDPRSVLSYAHDVPEHRRAIVESLPIGQISDTPAPPPRKSGGKSVA